MSPPPELTRVGRLNEEKSPMFYASHLFGAALAEVGAKDGDIVQVTGFSLPENSQNGLRCAITGEIYNAYRGMSTLSGVLNNNIQVLLGKLEGNPRALTSFVYMDALAGEILRRQDARNNEYVHSRTLSKELFNKLPDTEGVIYPSVALNGYTNIALKPSCVEKKLSVKFSAVVRVKKLYRYGMFDYDTIKTSFHVHENGDLEWKR